MLLDCYRAGDESALIELLKEVKRYFEFIGWKWARWRSCEVQDIVQECYTILLEGIDRIKTGPGSSPINYMLLFVNDKMRAALPHLSFLTRQLGNTYDPKKKIMTGRIGVLRNVISLSVDDYQVHRILYKVARRDS